MELLKGTIIRDVLLGVVSRYAQRESGFQTHTVLSKTEEELKKLLKRQGSLDPGIEQAILMILMRTNRDIQKYPRKKLGGLGQAQRRLPKK
jgi:hypothetical protein